nr:MAG: replication associated protein [Cressdnaviricota sp.]
MKNQLRARGWQFTWNNYTDTDVEYLKTLDFEYICWGLEVGAQKTPHIQGFIYFKNPKAFTSVRKLLKENHVSEARSYEALMKYNAKDGDFFESGIRPSQGRAPERGLKQTGLDVVRTTTTVEEPYGWQLQVMQIIVSPPSDTRTIHWFWESTGGVGKTSLCKYLCVKHDAILIGGKGDNCRFAVAKWVDSNKRHPEIILINIPRSVEHISYTAIEEVKDGIFFSGKYESGQVIYNSPHVFIFANTPPDMCKLSKDRWNVVHIVFESSNTTLEALLDQLSQ